MWAMLAPWFGLAASAIGGLIAGLTGYRAMPSAAAALQYGCTWINTHFIITNEMPHGGLKQSGYGKDMSMYALEEYTCARHVMVKW